MGTQSGDNNVFQSTGCHLVLCVAALKEILIWRAAIQQCEKCPDIAM
jgi:hypothetical protein